MCPMFETGVESLIHLFCDCPSISSIQDRLWGSHISDSFWEGNILDWLTLNSNPIYGYPSEWDVKFAVALDIIWQRYNYFVFRGI